MPDLTERLREAVTLEYSRHISERDKLDETTLGDEALARIEELEKALEEIAHEQSAPTGTVAADRFQAIARAALLSQPHTSGEQG